jgi:hypothetical protein
LFGTARFAIMAAAIAAGIAVLQGTEMPMMSRLLDFFVLLSVIGSTFFAGRTTARDQSVVALKNAGIFLYFAAGLAAVSTLYTSFPPAVFWVVSALVPAWQSRRLAKRGDLQESYRMLVAAIRIFMWVLLVAIWLPTALMYR